jgi:uncharacterized protein DUF5658
MGISSTEAVEPTVADRRISLDRRRRPTTLVGALTSRGRRRGFRRTGEGKNTYVDCPRGQVALWALAVILLSATDAFLTLLHVRAGGRELTPTMHLALLQGENMFVGTKMAVTAGGVLLLALHQNFAIARLGFRLVIAIYAALMAYHLALIALR